MQFFLNFLVENTFKIFYVNKEFLFKFWQLLGFPFGGHLVPPPCTQGLQSPLVIGLIQFHQTPLEDTFHTF